MSESPDHINLNPSQLQLLTTEQAWHYHIVPKQAENGLIDLYADETKIFPGIEEELEILLGKNVRLEKVSPLVIHKTLSKYYLRQSRGGKTAEAKHISASSGDDFLPTLITEARSLQSSDIHIESYEEKCRVRFRIDGMLVERYLISKQDYPALINKIKIRASLDIAEKRLPQDGRIFFQHGAHRFDIRVSILPTLHGEKIVLRLLSNDATGIDIRQLGFSEQQLGDYLEGIKRPHGILLISGPTGSGKTTTLYATLKILNETTTNILTIEDPIEYTLEGINQVQVKDSIGLTFASVLRTFLRQDPNIIMLGEIRDGETAQMAIRAALTGHLVLSTIHTNSAWGTISRLTDMGIPPFLVADTLNTSVAQRLVRLLCPDCKTELEFDSKLLPKSFKAPRALHTHYVTQGCPACYYTGYRGRKAIYEVLPIDQAMAELIKAQQEQKNINPNKLIRERGISTLADQAFALLESGMTTIEEVYPVLSGSSE